jgi:hypothetical protein
VGAVSDQSGDLQRQVAAVDHVQQGVRQPAAIVHGPCFLESLKLQQQAVLPYSDGP